MLTQFELFDPEELYLGTVLKQQPRKARPALGWQLADHACRYCFGRILQRISKGRVLEVRCAECGAREEGDVDLLCCCGADCGDLGRALMCVKNPDVSRELPHEVVIRERPRAVVEEIKTTSRPVKLREF